ncbi:hypothetical protein ES703_70051 [subsurface metagenome]
MIRLRRVKPRKVGVKIRVAQVLRLVGRLVPVSRGQAPFEINGQVFVFVFVFQDFPVKANSFTRIECRPLCFDLGVNPTGDKGNHIAHGTSPDRARSPKNNASLGVVYFSQRPGGFRVWVVPENFTNDDQTAS